MARRFDQAARAAAYASKVVLPSALSDNVLPRAAPAPVRRPAHRAECRGSVVEFARVLAASNDREQYRATKEKWVTSSPVKSR